MGSHHTPHLQQLEGHAGRAWSSIQQRLQQLVQPSQYDAELLHLAAPALAAMLLEPIMNVISAAVLGHLGTQQLGAVSLASLATSLATYIFSFLVFLTTPRIAAAHAHGDSKQVSRLAAVGLWLAAVTGTAVAIGMHAGAGWIVQGEPWLLVGRLFRLAQAWVCSSGVMLVMWTPSCECQCQSAEAGMLLVTRLCG